MTGSRVALVVDDQELAGSIQAHLQKHLNQPAHCCTFAQIHDYLDHHADGLLLIAAATELEAAATMRLVQDICLQKLPPVVVLLDTKSRTGTTLDSLEPYVSRRLSWPDDA